MMGRMKQAAAIILMAALAFLAGCQAGGGANVPGLGSATAKSTAGTVNPSTKSVVSAKSLRTDKSVRGPSLVQPLKVKPTRGPTAVQPLKLTPTRTPTPLQPLKFQPARVTASAKGSQAQAKPVQPAPQPPQQQQPANPSWWHTWLGTK